MMLLENYEPVNLIINDLYLGNVDAASDYNLLKKLGITHIVRVLRDDVGTIFPDFKYKIILLEDLPDQNISKYFKSAHNFIDSALSGNNNRTVRNKVLVHCLVGMSRSATIVISYLLHKYPGYTLEKALKFVRSKRPIVNPNEGFLKQLKQFEEQLEDQRQEEKLNIRIILNKAKIQKLKDIEMNRNKNFEDNKIQTPRPIEKQKIEMINTPRRFIDKVERERPSLFRNNGLGIAHGFNHSVKNFNEFKQDMIKKDINTRRMILPVQSGLAFDYPKRQKLDLENRRYHNDELKNHKVSKFWSPQRDKGKAFNDDIPDKLYYLKRQHKLLLPNKPAIRTSHPRKYDIIQENYFMKVNTPETRVETPSFGRRF